MDPRAGDDVDSELAAPSERMSKYRPTVSTTISTPASSTMSIAISPSLSTKMSKNRPTMPTTLSTAVSTRMSTASPLSPSTKMSKNMPTV